MENSRAMRSCVMSGAAGGMGYGELRKELQRLTIAVLVLFQLLALVATTPVQEHIRKEGKALTKREKASLNSETCSSVRVSACDR